MVFRHKRDCDETLTVATMRCGKGGEMSYEPDFEMAYRIADSENYRLRTVNAAYDAQIFSSEQENKRLRASNAELVAVLEEMVRVEAPTLNQRSVALKAAHDKARAAIAAAKGEAP